MLIGYARVSTSDQKLDLQLDALRQAGCEKIFDDMASGAKTDRPGLAKAMEHLRKGDTLVVWKLDRIGRSLPHLIETVATLREKGIEFKSLQEGMDTASSSGQLIFNIFASLAQFERDLIRERTNAGLQAARSRGRNGGRPKALDDKKVKLARKLYNSKEMSVSQICDTVGVTKSTLYRYLQ